MHSSVTCEKRYTNRLAWLNNQILDDERVTVKWHNVQGCLLLRWSNNDVNDTWYCQYSTGEPELCYWQKAAADRQKKHNSQKSRTTRRGRDKVFTDICIILHNV